MSRAEDILKKPYITEKSNIQIADGKYTFIVPTNVTKTEIRYAVEKLFKVKVKKVNTIKYEGKMKRMGVHKGRRPGFKKAIVKIDVDPKVESYKIKGGKDISTNKNYKTNIEVFEGAQ